jgi:hypothetical protein
MVSLKGFWKNATEEKEIQHEFRYDTLQCMEDKNHTMFHHKVFTCNMRISRIPFRSKQSGTVKFLDTDGLLNNKI